MVALISREEFVTVGFVFKSSTSYLTMISFTANTVRLSPALAFVCEYAARD